MKRLFRKLRRNVTLGRVSTYHYMIAMLMLLSVSTSCSKDETPSNSNQPIEEVCGTKVSHRQTDISLDGEYHYFITLNNDGEFAKQYRVSIVEYDRYKMRNGEFICITPIR